MIMYIYLRVLLECGGTRRRTDDLQAMMCQDSLLVVFGVCVAHEYFRLHLGATRRMRDLKYTNIGGGPVDLYGRVCGVQRLLICVYARSQTSSNRQSLVLRQCSVHAKVADMRVQRENLPSTSNCN